MPTIDNFSAWIQVDNQPLPEYQIEYSLGGTKVTCWIPSEAGKEFQICHRDNTRSKTTGSKVKIDGNACPGKIIYSRRAHPGRNGTVVQRGISGDNSSFRPFVFSHCCLVEDESDQLLTDLSAIGEIRIKIDEVQVGSRTASRGDTNFAALQIYEKAKKGIAHGTQLGAAVPRATKLARKTVHKRKLVSFVFRYRPMAVLMADGIAPQAASPTPVKREHATSSSIDLIDLTLDNNSDDNLGRTRRNAKRIKREVKQERSVTYDDAVIDLTI